MKYKHLSRQLAMYGVDAGIHGNKLLKKLSKKIPEKDISAAIMCYIRTSFRNVTPALVIYQNDDLIVIVYLEKNTVNIVKVDDIDLIKPIKTPPPLSGIDSEDWDILLRTSKNEWVLTGDSGYDKVLSFLEVFDKKAAVEDKAPLNQKEISSKKTILFPDNQILELNVNLETNEKYGGSINKNQPQNTDKLLQRETGKPTRTAVKINHITLSETGGVKVEKLLPGLINLDVIDLLKMRYAIKREYNQGSRTFQEFQILTTAINKTIFLKKHANRSSPF